MRDLLRSMRNREGMDIVVNWYEKRDGATSFSRCLLAMTVKEHLIDQTIYRDLPVFFRPKSCLLAARGLD
jgi:hypothetical protein